MKKIVLLSLVVLAVFSTQTVTAEKKQETRNAQEKSRILIAYFSIPETDGVDAVAGASRLVSKGKVFGNTQWVADRIQEETGGVEIRIETVQKYPGKHAALVDQGAAEKKNNSRPKLGTKIHNITDFDVIFIGYPIWWADLPMPLYTFLTENDFSGKTIIPFSTHGGSGFADTIQTIASLVPNAKIVRNGLTVSRNSVKNSSDEIADWVRSMKL